MQTISSKSISPKKADPYVSSFEQLEKGRFQKDPAWLRAVRKAGIAHFVNLGFPTTDHEEWRFTNVTSITKLPFNPVLEYSANDLTSKKVKPITFEKMKGSRLVFVDGHFSKELSVIQPNSIKIGSLAAAIATDSGILEQYLARHARFDENAFTALNTAFFFDGAFVFIPDGVVVDEPIHLLFISTAKEMGTTIHPRNLLIVGKGSKATFIESYESHSKVPYFTNALTEIVLEENAVVEHCKLQNEALQSFHIATIHAYQRQNSHFTSHSISVGAQLARNNIHVVLDGEGIDSILNGLYLANGTQLVDHHTVVDHAKPNCGSHEYYHGILDGKSKGVFNGKIFVRKDAQKTDAKQTNRNLLLSSDATIDTKPQLEIFADDVKCTHGATVGQLDEEAIFYLKSRGIGHDTARSMLIHAFASEVLNRIKMKAVQVSLDKLLNDYLDQSFHLSSQE